MGTSLLTILTARYFEASVMVEIFEYECVITIHLNITRLLLPPDKSCLFLP